MRKTILKILLSAFMLVAFAAAGMAEPPDFERPPSKEQMEKVRERIETLRMWKLTKALDLDEKTSAQLFPLLNKYDRKRFVIEQALRDGMRDLRDALRNRREGQLRGILDRLEQNHKEMQRVNDEEWAEMKRILTIEQQARFIIFKQEFDREIRKIIAEARERRPERFGKDRPPLPPGRP
ncbi:MAG: hypothetical protein OHK0032_13420 [Thermodesulfovibrionales bacterium]